MYIYFTLCVKPLFGRAKILGTEDKNLFSPIFLAGAMSAQTVFLIAVAALACLLGAEIAGICILVSKIVRHSKRKNTYEASSSKYRHFGMVPVMLFGTLGQTGYTTLAVLVVLTVLAALVFLALLIVLRVRGYDFVAAGKLAKAETVDEPSRPEPEAEPVPVYAVPDSSEEQQQEAYAEADADITGDEPEAIEELDILARTFADAPEAMPRIFFLWPSRGFVPRR